MNDNCCWHSYCVALWLLSFLIAEQILVCPGSSWAEVIFTMYSPQSLHRWGITHTESMERLAYSQGKQDQIAYNFFSIILWYNWPQHYFLNWVLQTQTWKNWNPTEMLHWIMKTINFRSFINFGGTCIKFI